MTEQSQQKAPSQNQQSQKEQPDIRANKNQDDKMANKKPNAYESDDSNDSDTTGDAKWSQKSKAEIR